MDEELRRAFCAWLATRPKSVPAPAKLERAERRLLGSIKRGEPRDKLAANAERVRRAQLNHIKATEKSAELPTDADDEQARSQRENRAAAKAAWGSAPVDEIVAWYSA